MDSADEWDEGHPHSPPYEPGVWVVDGERHVVGSSDCCSGGIAGKCRKCGGRLHMQPVYGGVCYWCEQCGDEP